MCIFSKPVSHVSKTNIVSAIALGNNNTRYHVVSYGNQVSLDQRYGSTNAMILPIPNNARDLVLLQSHHIGHNEASSSSSSSSSSSPESAIMDWSRALHKRSHEYVQRTIRRNASNSACDDVSFSLGARKGGTLTVVSVGSYRCSIVHNIADAERLDANLFRMNDSLKAVLRQRYGDVFGFIVAVLSDTKEFHPFTYAYPLAADDAHLSSPPS